MSHALRISLFAGLIGGLSASALSSEESRFDLLIRNGMVIDGTGSAAVKADLLVKGDRIVQIGALDVDPSRANKVIDASGMVVTPGFIDAHSHGDPRDTPEFDNFLAMGVTTICLGQDGSSPDNLAQWMAEVYALQPGVNVAMFVGHGSVRTQAGVDLGRAATPAECRKLRDIVGEAMRSGCFGLTTGLEYLPGTFADADELKAVAQAVAEFGGLVMSHMRSEDDDAIEASLAELFDQGRAAGCPVHVSHVKVTHGRGAARAEQILALLDQARQGGLRVTADIYPYTASYTGISIVFPDWAKPPNDYAEVVRTRREELADYLRQRVTARNGPAATLFGTGRFAGKTLADVAAELDKPFEDVLIDDLGLSGGQAAYFVMDEGLQDRLLVDPQVMICTDGGPRSAHPRGHGAFARVIRHHVLDKKLLSLEEAVRKMTSLPSEAIGLSRLKRGRLAEGWAADILVFDPAAVRDTATYQSPRLLAEGMSWVIVNGQVVREGGTPTGERAGRMLRNPDVALERKVDEFFADFDRPDVPGASVAVYQHGSVLFAKGYGLANLETREPATPETNYRLASVSKQFTAMCIMLLKQRGLLDYDDPISRHLEGFPAIGEKITVRHLLHHTSGLHDYEDLIPEGQTAQLTDRDVPALLMKTSETYFPPGSEYRYSNSGYALLALIVEKVSGKDFATFLKEHIFVPLDMEHTVAFEDGVSTITHRAFGYAGDGDRFKPLDQSLTSAVLGDGGIYTSVLDYARWDRALYGEALVGAATLKEAFTSCRLADGHETGYGFGWRIETRDGERIIGHDGETCGFNTAVRRLPQRGLTVAILANRAGRDAREMADRMVDYLRSCADEALPRSTSAGRE